MPKQPDDLQFIQGIEQRVMGLPVCTIPGEQTEHGFHVVAPLHAPGELDECYSVRNAGFRRWISNIRTGILSYAITEAAFRCYEISVQEIKEDGKYDHWCAKSCRILGNKLTNHSCGIIINPVFVKGASSMKYSVIIRIDMVRLAPYTLTR